MTNLNQTSLNKSHVFSFFWSNIQLVETKLELDLYFILRMCVSEL